MVLCKCGQCGYYNQGYCEQKFPSFDEGGHCTHLYLGGMLRPDAFAAIDDIYKNKVYIIDAEVQDDRYENNETKDEGTAESGNIKECESCTTCGVDSKDGVSTGDNFSNGESPTVATGTTEIHDGITEEQRSDELVEGV